jgi:hypothetical protein
MADEQVGGPDDEPRVAEVLEQLKAGVRQRQAELATIAKDLEELPAALAYAHRIQYVEEPENVSHRPVIGPLVVLVKKVAYKLGQWYHQAVLRQQNEVNRAVSLALRDLFERQRMLLREVQSLRRDLDALAGSPDGERRRDEEEP